MTAFPPIERDDWLGAPEGLRLAEGGSVTTPEGYAAAGVASGAKTDRDARDIGILMSTRPNVAALVDTVNALPSVPVKLNRTRDRRAFRAVLVNASKANAATGAAGREDALAMLARAAENLDVPVEQIAACSTGTIGERIDLDLALPGIDAAAAGLAQDGGPAFAEAICTTDRAPKTGAFTLDLPGGAVRIGIAAKGAGMIRPTMATMLAFVTTDAALVVEDLQAAAADAAAASFNRISVDGQMSPSDTLLVLANGQGDPLEGEDLAAFRDALAAVCRWAAIQMVKDGEGAEHAVRVRVEAARDADEAERVARAVGDSPLVKTALFGRDPNWGRISQAVGAALARTPGVPADLAVAIDGAGLSDPAAGAAMEKAEYDITVRLGRGVAAYDLWACDLGQAYVSLNAEYHT
ncbi:MAG: bifunctional glutamate N-acetyltransferase/amino-acid acetyltransferase ArgJ [Thermoleophilia bacterium]|nr:bifunctional glutamate N-acetyltransferase/amino-acid acetyltransferase ArgJ [Thermoleophilia bacterium]